MPDRNGTRDLTQIAACGIIAVMLFAAAGASYAAGKTGDLWLFCGLGWAFIAVAIWLICTQKPHPPRHT